MKETTGFTIWVYWTIFLAAILVYTIAVRFDIIQSSEPHFIIKFIKGETKYDIGKIPKGY